ncbi:MAG: type VI secretion system tip protein TssI/VgrG [Polyangiales bacterium]
MQLRAFLTIDALPSDAPVVRFTATESLAALFDVDVTFVCDDPELDLDASLWRIATLSLADDDGSDPRYFHGVIEEADYVGTRDGRFLYRVQIRPRIHGLAYRIRSRIFQSKTAIEVIERVLRDAGLPAESFRWGLSARYPTREYCVQYRESELAFVTRLLEDEGVFWRFEHSAADHVMVFGDSPAAHAPIADDVIPYVRGDHQGRERVTDLVYAVRVLHDAWNARDWNPDDPARPREAVSDADGASSFTRAEFPGGFVTEPDGLRRAGNRLDAARADGELLEGRTNVRRVMPGGRFTVTGAMQPMIAREWLTVSVEHRYVDRGLAGEGGESATYDLYFKAIPSEVRFRPARVTPKPRVWGVDTGVITGPSSEEICVDDRGRVKVHLYWDREGAVDDTSSCWIRTQQQNTSGAMTIPRIGWEVSVGYLDGDPDRPFVLQRLYNQETMPPYGLPAAATQSALQTSTSPGGAGTNEVRLQDGNGGMEFFMHASRDLRVTAGHDLAETIDVDAAEEVGVDLASEVGANQTIHVGGSASASVTGACNATVAGSRAVNIGGNDDWGVKTSQSIVADGARAETIRGMMNVLANTVTETFNANCTRSVGAALCINSAIAIAESVGGSKREQVGAARIELVRKAYAENVHTAKTLVAGAAILKTGADLQSNAQGAMAFNVTGPIVETCGEGYSIGARVVLVNTANLKLEASGSSLTASAGSLKFKGGSLVVKGSVSVKLKGNVDFQ